MCGEGFCVAFIDGASSGNPGPSSYAYLIRHGEGILRGSGYLGRRTNNYAEYQALLHCLRRALKLGCRSVSVYSDSQLLVKQVLGEYRVRDPQLKKLRDEAVELISRFQSFEIKHIPREQNSDANRLAAKVLAKILRKKGDRVDG
ncbi:MAG: ribonuclease HI family protein [Nitrososphaerota archaeon]